MASKVYSFKKEERLCSKKFLTKLFDNGSSFLVYPFRAVWISSPNQNQSFPIQVVISVPKKRFKSAVDRNLIKRRTKEVYRLGKEQQLYPAVNLHQKKILLALSYVGKEIHDFNYIQQKLHTLFKTLILKLQENEGS
jgi:ribonuclease P protein component